jgi:hypothetical protein
MSPLPALTESQLPASRKLKRRPSTLCTPWPKPSNRLELDEAIVDGRKNRTKKGRRISSPPFDLTGVS